ncbi:alpha/beta hydrolase family protein, partial [Kitasatospora sp. NPDC057223]|uniref:alpha/beta hydrolase family protein n=1 Tax=Kitasatospora sp. NPDC057223 TaxID=3346055 RepID=UPI003625AF34
QAPGQRAAAARPPPPAPTHPPEDPMQTTADPDAHPAAPARARVEHDILRAPRDGTLPTVDLHLPSGGTARPPLVIDVSGWARPHRPAATPWAPELAAHGIAVATVHNRHTPRHDHALRDLRNLVRLLRKNAGAFGPAPERIGLFGRADAAYLAALAAYSTVDPRAQVQALAGVGGTWGIETAPDLDARRPARTPRRSADAEVLHQVCEVALATGNDVPLLVVSGAGDRTAPAEHGVRFAEVVTAAGGRASVLLLGESGHGDADLDPALSAGAVAAFFHRTLHTAPHPVPAAR